jgi:hypothetical protein
MRRSMLMTLVFAGQALADSRPSRLSPDLDALPPNAAQIYRDTTLFPQEAKWLAIPWVNDLKKAIRTAKEEKRPVLIWVSGDDPLERC